MNAAPATNRYQDKRLRRGNATSCAPIIIGTRKLPRVAGMDGTKKNQTIMMPCSVNSRLYGSAVMNQPVGLIKLEPHETDGDAADEEENVIDRA